MRLKQIDVIRGLAALSVAITHASPYFAEGPLRPAASAFKALFANTFWANAGLHPGVIVFIVLSGFCIHMPMAKEPALADGGAFWRTYAKRRVLRIVPVFLLGCVLGALAVGVDPAALVSAVAFSAFVPVGFVPGNEILHTVIVEMWLYAAYPLTLAIYRRFGAVPLLGLAAVIHALPIAFVLAGLDPTWAQRSWYAFYLYWVLGMLAVEAFMAQRPLSFIPVAGAFAIYVASSHLIEFKGSHYPKSLMLALCAAMLLVAWRNHRFFSDRWVKVGEASYTLYVVHFPLITMWAAMVPGQTITSQLGLIAFIATCTALGFLLVERPSHRLAKSWGRPLVVA